jgi:hypothetical protein
MSRSMSLLRGKYSSLQQVRRPSTSRDGQPASRQARCYDGAGRVVFNIPVGGVA